MIARMRVRALACLIASAFVASCAHGNETDGMHDGGPPTPRDTGVDELGFSDGCGSLEVTFTRRVPTVMLLIDQSSSMNEPFGTASRWNVVREALVGTGGVVPLLDKEIRFGATLYESQGGFGGGACPKLKSTKAIAQGTSAAIRALLEAEVPGGDTPTGESIDAVAVTLAAFAPPGPKYIVLATDGQPDTCAQPNPDEGTNEAVAAVRTAFSKGIGTYIVSVGSGVSAAHLQEMANAGAGWKPGDPPAKPYPALDAVALRGAFHDIIYGVRSCFFRLDGKVKSAAVGTVTLDGTPIGYGDADGWRIDGDSELELTGRACAKIKAGDHDLKVIFPCDAFIR